MTAGDGRDPFAVNQDRTLDALTLAWGDSYEIYITDGRWQAWHDERPRSGHAHRHHPRRAEPRHPRRLRGARGRQRNRVSASGSQTTAPAPPAAWESGRYTQLVRNKGCPGHTVRTHHHPFGQLILILIFPG